MKNPILDFAKGHELRHKQAVLVEIVDGKPTVTRRVNSKQDVVIVVSPGKTDIQDITLPPGAVKLNVTSLAGAEFILRQYAT